MLYSIPLTPVPSQKFAIILNNKECNINIYMRGDYYYLDFYMNGEVIVTGIICNIFQSLLPKTNNFSGSLYFVNLDDNKELDYQGFGSKYLLIYDDGAS